MESQNQGEGYEPAMGDRILIVKGDQRYKATVVKYKPEGHLRYGCLVDGFESQGKIWFGRNEMQKLEAADWHVINLRCEAGHEQQIKLAAKDYNEAAAHDFGVLIAGGTLKSIGRDMPGHPCQNAKEGEASCGMRVSFTLSTEMGKEHDQDP